MSAPEPPSLRSVTSVLCKWTSTTKQNRWAREVGGEVIFGVDWKGCNYLYSQTYSDCLILPAASKKLLQT